jgi:hypothetical protein
VFEIQLRSCDFECKSFMQAVACLTCKIAAD